MTVASALLRAVASPIRSVLGDRRDPRPLPGGLGGPLAALRRLPAALGVLGQRPSPSSSPSTPWRCWRRCSSSARCRTTSAAGPCSLVAIAARGASRSCCSSSPATSTTLAVARVVQGLATGAAISTLGAALIDLTPAARAGPRRPRQRRRAARRARARRAGLRRCSIDEFAPAPDAPRLRRPARPPRRRGGRRRAHARDVGAGAPAGGPRCARASACPPACAATSSDPARARSRAGRSAGSTCRSGRRSRRRLLRRRQPPRRRPRRLTLLCGTGALDGVRPARARPRDLLAFAAALLAAGLAITLAGIELAARWRWPPPGTVVAGSASAPPALGCFGTLARVAAPAERGEVFALAYVVATSPSAFPPSPPASRRSRSVSRYDARLRRRDPGGLRCWRSSARRRSAACGTGRAPA